MGKSALAAVAAELEPHFAEDADRRKKATEGRPRKSDLKPEEKVPQVIARQPQAASQKVATLPPIEKSKSRADAAKSVGVGERYVQDAKKVKTEAPEVFERLKAGKITLQDAVWYVDKSICERPYTIRAYGAGEIELPEVADKARKETIRYVNKSTCSHPYTVASLAKFLGWQTFDEAYPEGRPSHACNVAFQMRDVWDRVPDSKAGEQGLQSDRKLYPSTTLKLEASSGSRRTRRQGGVAGMGRVPARLRDATMK